MFPALLLLPDFVNNITYLFSKVQTCQLAFTVKTMDVELFCHDMAQKLCVAAGKKYWFCNDYDVELVDIGKVIETYFFVYLNTKLTK